jgi:hypothetical protein
MIEKQEVNLNQAMLEAKDLGPLCPFVSSIRVVVGPCGLEPQTWPTRSARSDLSSPRSEWW